MTVLFKRRARLSIGLPGQPMWVAPEGLKIGFNITKTIDPEPNKATINVWNLKKDNRNRIQRRGDIVKLELGYGSDPAWEVVFLGEIRFVDHQHIKADVMTRIESGDGDYAFNNIIMNETLGSGGAGSDGTSVKQVFDRLKTVFTTEMAAKFNTDDTSVIRDYDSIIDAIANEATSVINGVLQTSTGKFRKGVTMRGAFGDVMNNMSERVGIDFFQNNMVMHVLKKTDILNMSKLALNTNTGMIGSPAKLEDGSLKVKSLIVPGMLVGRGLVVDSFEVNPDLDRKITRLSLRGDTHGSQWNADTDAELLVRPDESTVSSTLRAE